MHVGRARAQRAHRHTGRVLSACICACAPLGEQRCTLVEVCQLFPQRVALLLHRGCRRRCCGRRCHRCPRVGNLPAEQRNLGGHLCSRRRRRIQGRLCWITGRTGSQAGAGEQLGRSAVRQSGRCRRAGEGLQVVIRAARHEGTIRQQGMRAPRRDGREVMLQRPKAGGGERSVVSPAWHQAAPLRRLLGCSPPRAARSVLLPYW